ncbi:MAG: diguanylate cyclase [Armatimonadetes bacterium]|nr:diguanylate cyclase [Armatimonadota bacterium]
MSAPIVRLDLCPPALQQQVREALLAAGLLPESELGVAPDVVVVWVSGDDGATQVAALREGLTPPMPAVLAVGIGPPDDFASAVALDADACLSEGEPQTIARTCALLAWSRQRFLQTSPLTGLPGNAVLAAEIERRLPRRGELAVLAFDLDTFKGYNDRYGYERGDALLRWLAALLRNCLSSGAQPGWLLGHLGGDDFLALVHPDEAETVARTAIARFEAEIATHYDPEDRAAGGIWTVSRSGEPVWHPLVSLTVAQATNEADDITHGGQLAAILAELKQYGKTLAGSRYVPDRRRTHLWRPDGTCR